MFSAFARGQWVYKTAVMTDVPPLLITRFYLHLLISQSGFYRVIYEAVISNFRELQLSSCLELFLVFFIPLPYSSRYFCKSISVNLCTSDAFGKRRK